jgi:hypothetical protein
MTDETRLALINVLHLARTGANETFANMKCFQADMHDILVVEQDLLGEIPQ